MTINPVANKCCVCIGRIFMMIAKIYKNIHTSHNKYNSND